MDPGEAARSGAAGAGSTGGVGSEAAGLLHSIINHVRGGVLIETSDRVVLLINQACCDLFAIGASPLSLRGMPASDISPALAAAMEAAPPPPESADACERSVYPFKTAGGLTVECCYTLVRLDANAAVHVWQFHDASETRGRDLELEASRQRLRELTAHLEDVREEERRSLAQALHDEVGQTLTSVRLELSAAIDQFRRSGGVPTVDAIDRLQAAVGLVDLSLDMVRRVSKALRPPLLDQFGLVPAVKWEAAVFEQRTGIRCRVDANPKRFGLPPSHVTVLYRILLEALTNVARHAHASAVDIRLRAEPAWVAMEVQDNGRGITDAEAANDRTMGLLGMRERALSVGGEVTISGTRHGGTRVSIRLPLGAGEPGTTQ
jgi:signal transduction histidine kinase